MNAGRVAAALLLGVTALLAAPSIHGGAEAATTSSTAGTVRVQTVPALAGIRLTIAGTTLTTGPNGTATTHVTNIDHITTATTLTSTTLDNGSTVSISKIITNHNPRIRHTRNIQVGLNITSPVQLALDPGTSGVPTTDIHTARLHSSTGTVITIHRTNNGWPTTNLASRHTTLTHGTLIAHTITWTVDSLTTNPPAAVTAARTPFDPLGQPQWTLHLQPIPGTVHVQTVPALAGIHLTIAGTTLTTGPDGTATVLVPSLNGVSGTLRLATPNVTAEAGQGGPRPGSSGDVPTVTIRKVVTLPPGAPRQRRLLVALAVSQPITLAFADPNGRPIPPGAVQEVTLRGNHGTVTLRGNELTRPVHLVRSIAQLRNGHWQVLPIGYSVTRVKVAGVDAVFAGRQSLPPGTSGIWTIRLSLYAVTIRLRDALFGTGLTSAVLFTNGAGATTHAVAESDTATVIAAMVRGEYTVHVKAAALGGQSRLLVSRDTVADLRVITVLDVAVAGASGLLVIGALIVAGWLLGRTRRVRPAVLRPRRPHPAAHAPARPPGRRRRLAAAVAASMLLCALISTLTGPVGLAVPVETSARPASTGDRQVPVYAYFYQWFTPTSWNRAKQDYPLIGRYSSADGTVVRTQIRQAQSAGLDGFLTSWKNTPQLDGNLQKLIDTASSAKFDLGVVYEALDFARKPLPITTVKSDMLYLLTRWSAQLRSRYFGKPVIIWTGTNEFSPADVAAVHEAIGGRALLLAASKSVADYQAIAGDVDGEAYYWSSADPRSSATTVKLSAMAAAVRSHQGVWIAPAAAGFDGRSLGHSRVIDRAGGQTLSASLSNAFASGPSAVGVISWNEWSENTYIEPGERYGSRELDALRTDLAARGYPIGTSSATPTGMTATPRSTPAPGTSPPSRNAATGGGATSSGRLAPVSGAAVRPAPGGAHGLPAWTWPAVAAIIVLLAGAGLVATRLMRRRPARR